MATTIRNKRGTTKPAASDLVTGEIAIKTDDAKLFIENESFVNAKEIRFQIKKSAIDRHILLEEIGLLV